MTHLTLANVLYAFQLAVTFGDYGMLNRLGIQVTAEDLVGETLANVVADRLAPVQLDLTSR